MRKIIYGASLAVFVAVSSLTLTSILLPRWLSYTKLTPAGPITYTYGLHTRCSSTQTSPSTPPITTCTHFPPTTECHGHSRDRYFCSMWRTVAFLMTFALVFEGAAVTAFIAILAGGRKKREGGWGVLTLLILGCAMTQCAAMAIVAYLYDYDDRFFVGWTLDWSWGLTVVSWSVMVVLAGFVSMAGWLLPPEDGYEFLK